VTYCTIVEFEWDDSFDHQQFASSMAANQAAAGRPNGRLSHIASIDDKGARMIEVWESANDARAFAEQSASQVTAMALPPPTRVSGFEVTSYDVS
jgi:hypothetical protein